MIPMKLGLQQRIFPAYRQEFFELLAMSCEGGFSLFSGDAEEWEHVSPSTTLTKGTYVQAKNVHLGKDKYYFCYQQNLIRWLKKTMPEALVLEANPRYLSSRLGIRWMQKQNKPVIGWGLGAPQSGNFLITRLWQDFVNKFDAIIAYSQQGKREYMALGVSEEKIFVAPNAVLPPPTEAYKPRRQHNQLNVLYVGRLQARKKVDVLIKTCARFRSKGERMALIIVGDGPEKENLQALANQLFPATKFIGAKYGKDVKPYFEQADIFVLPGTGGLAVQEAMFYGLPVIVAEADGTQSNMVHPENGWVIDPTDPTSLIDAMGQALAMRQNLSAMGKVSFQIASNEVNILQMVKVFERAIRYAQKRRDECEFLP